MQPCSRKRRKKTDANPRALGTLDGGEPCLAELRPDKAEFLNAMNATENELLMGFLADEDINRTLRRNFFLAGKDEGGKEGKMEGMKKHG